MGNGSYGFLPWIRQGLANKITIPDPKRASANPARRVSIDVSVNFDGNVITKPLELVGPGDILGVSRKNIVRTEPLANVFDFESNYLPFIEFFEEDFLWRYTPARANGTEQLRPWLALIALRDEEYSLVPATSDLPAQLTVMPQAYGDVFHLSSEHWAYGHVHVNRPNAAAVSGLSEEQTYIANVKSDLKKDPSVACSRLLCPRKLQRGASYTCFLIPAFELGRLAGLGAPLNNTDALQPSWTDNGQPVAGTNVFPVYYQWRFGTGETGDFTALARKMKAATIASSLGGRTMKVSDTGDALLNRVFPPQGTVPQTVQMESALSPAGFAAGYKEAAPAAALAPYIAQLKTTLAPAGSADPVVAPPVYGRWQTADTLDATSPDSKWMRQINLDARYRAAAGLGAKVVRERQEDLMQTAWKQVGEVLLVNEKIQRARFGVEASMAVFSKHLVGSAATSADKGLGRAVKLAAPGLKKIKLSGTPNAALGIPTEVLSADTVTISKASYFTPLTRGGVSSAFAKLSRNGSPQVKRLDRNGAVVNASLIANLGNAVVTPAKSIKLYESPNAAVANYPSRTVDNRGIAYNPYFGIYSGQEAAFQSGVRYLDQLETKYNPPPPPIDQTKQTALAGNIRGGLNPDASVTSRIKTAIALQAVNSTSTGGLAPVMAYPVIDEPMYDDLVAQSTEHLIPNISNYKPNTVSLLEANRGFIEAYMAGLNHEFSRELLWREYPTDQRGSYFRRFWDTADTENPTTTPEYFNDIKPMHLWSGSLGANHTGRHGASMLVLVVRAELLKKFPNAVIYACNAAGSPSGRILGDDVLMPAFRSVIQPDIILVGFNLDKSVAIGSPSGAGGYGYFFVFQERPGQPRFGLEDAPANFSRSNPNSGTSIASGLHWGFFPKNKLEFKDVTLTKPGDPVNLIKLNAGDASGYLWDTDSGNAAGVAAVLLQKPTLIAIHADDLIQ